jgi:transcriptional regulator of acetoin/glycerol metabolism
MKSTVAVLPLAPELGLGLAFHDDAALPAHDLPAESLPPQSLAPSSGVEIRRLKAARRAAIDRFEVEYVRELLQRSQGNVTKAAALADVSRQVIHKLIAKHRL